LARAEVTPLHRSPDALRVEAALAVERDVLLPLAVEPLLLAFDGLGAVELAKTDCPPCVVTPAVDPLARALIAPWRAALGEP